MIVARFLDPLIVRKVGHRLWVLEHEFRFDSAVLGCRLIVDKGRETDFASHPETPLAKWIAGGYADAESVLHDEAYRVRLFPRALSDAMYLEAMETDGTALGIPRVPAWRRSLIHAGVRLGGWTRW